MFCRVYRFLGSTSGIFEGLFDEVADCEEQLLKGLFEKVLTVKLLLKRLSVKGLVVKGLLVSSEWCENEFLT